VSEAAFDAALASKDPVTTQRAFENFYGFRQHMDMEQEAAIRANVAQKFQRLGLPALDSDVPVDEYGFDTSIIKSYSAFLRQKHGLLGDLIRLHRGEDRFDRRPNKHLVVPAAEFPSKGRWAHIVAHGVILTFHTPLPAQEEPLIVVNLCLPFGWTGSPVHYSIAGQAIKATHISRPGFQNLVYCDDHILIDDSRRFETQVSGIALRRAMVTVLGTTACIEKKFTTWQRHCRALGLIFDFDSQTVSMPASKIAKIVGRLLALLGATKVTLRQLRETMGLLRYLGTCIPVAKPFYNRLQAFMCVLEKVSVPLRLQLNQVEDVRWLLALFRSDALQDMSMARLAGAIPPHDCINMDASDAGVCGVWHSQKKFFALQWNELEKESIRRFKEKSESVFSINYRELLGAYFSVILWCAEWRRVYGRDAHIRMVIDNVSAVAWTDTRHTKYPEAQCALRIMGLLEATSHGFTSSEHMPGEKNVWADTGSRSWDTKDSMLRFKSLCTNYEQVAVPEAWQNP
jgi:hypothetical protein